MTSAESWIEMYRAWGAAPTPESYANLFHPEGSVFDGGMERPVPSAALAEHMKRMLTIAPDLRTRVGEWRARGDAVFADLELSGTVGGRHMAQPMVAAVTLRDGRVLRGRRYYDRAPMFRALVPDLPQLPGYDPVRTPDLPAPETRRGAEAFVEAYSRQWERPDPQRFAAFYAPDGVMQNPGMPRPIARDETPGYYQLLLGLAPDLSMTLISWVGDDALLYVEWRGEGTIAERKLVLPIVDRFELRSGLVTKGLAFFDTLTVLATLQPELRETLAALG